MAHEKTPALTRARRVAALIATGTLILMGAVVTGSPASANGGTASISGTVARSDSPSTPVSGVRMILQSSDYSVYVETTTDAEGDYSFTELPLGDYRVKAEPSGGLATQWWQGASSEFEATLVGISTAGQSVAAIDFLLEEGASISGTVRGADGESIAGLEVFAESMSWNSYSVFTDASGDYTISGLPVGEYRLKVVGGDGWLGEWWNGATTRNTASIITIAFTGQAITGKDFQLERGGSISGTVTGPDGTPLESVEVWAQPESWESGALFTTTDASGAYTLAGVANERYTIRFIAPSGSGLRTQYWQGADWAREADWVTGVQGASLSGISAQLLEGATASGTVIDAVTGDPLEGIQVRLNPVEDPFGDEVSVTTQPDGSWTATGLVPDVEWTVRFEDNQGPDFYVVQYYDGVSSRQDATPIVPTLGAPLVGIDAAMERPATITGTVVNAEGDPLEGVQVRLAPAGGWAQTEADGSYTMTGVPPGTYRVLVGELDSAEPTYRREWFDNAYSNAAADTISVAADEVLSGLDFQLQTNTSPQYPAAPSLVGDVNPDGSVTVTVVPPGSQSSFFGVSATIESAREGDGFTHTPFDDFPSALTWSGDAHVKVSAQSFGPDGSGPAVRSLVVVGDGPSIRHEPSIGVDTLSTTSVELAWSVPATSVPIPGWSWVVHPVDRPGDQVIAAGDRDDSDGPFGSSTVITGLDPSTEYEAYVIGWKPEGGSTFWGVQRFTTAGPVDPGEPERLAGADRYATAAAISAAEYDPGVAVVFIATGTNYPDALSAAAAAAYQGGPLLLTAPDALPAVIRDEIVRLDPQRVVIAGGTSVVSARVRAEISGLVDAGVVVERYAGVDRYDTSRRIASGEYFSSDRAFIATGTNFPDALAASAAAGSLGMPVLLVNGAAALVDEPTVELLLDLGVSQTFIAGGPGAVSTSIQKDLESVFGEANVTRLSGGDRYQTAVEINQVKFPTASTVFLATGLGFADALAGAALAGRDAGPLFIVPRTCVPVAVLDEIDRLGPSRVVLFGGTSVLTSGVANLAPC